jgi:hypothetical protein
MEGVDQKDSRLGMYFAFFSVNIDPNEMLINDLCFPHKGAPVHLIANSPYLAVNLPF